MNADGQGRRHLGGGGVPQWSPDGTTILTSSFSNPTELAILDVATGAEQAITLKDHVFYSVPNWASDSQTLIAVIRAEGPLMIALVDVADPAAAKVKEVLWTRGQGTNAEPMYPTYSAATKRVAFAGRTPKGSSLYLLESRKSFTPKPLESDRYDPKIASLAISPDGRHLLFCSDRQMDPPNNAD